VVPTLTPVPAQRLLQHVRDLDGGPAYAHEKAVQTQLRKAYDFAGRHVVVPPARGAREIEPAQSTAVERRSTAQAVIVEREYLPVDVDEQDFGEFETYHLCFANELRQPRDGDVLDHLK